MPKREKKWKPVPLASILAVAARDGWVCHYCGILLAHDEVGSDPDPSPDLQGYRHLRPGYAFPVADHVVPKSRGGSYELSNLVLACALCNSIKRAWSAAEFWTWLRTRGQEHQPECLRHQQRARRLGCPVICCCHAAYYQARIAS